MSRGSPELTSARKEEIMSACLALYETKNFRDITLSDIAGFTSFSRPSIYNYFESKEEIFLALFQREYELWTADMERMKDAAEPMTPEAFARFMAVALERRPLLLKLLSMNMYDMEENSRMERLTEFKTAYGASMDPLYQLLGAFFPEMSMEEKERFLRFFFPFMYGIYPYAHVTEKQAEAMKRVGIRTLEQTVFELVYPVVLALLRSGSV